MMGKFGLGSMNGNEILFADFCAEHNFVIGGTLFQHKPVHIYTWGSRDGRTRNQIDQIAVSRKWTASIQDLRTRRGADVGGDHKLLVMKFKLSLKVKPKVQLKKMLNVGKLKREEVKEEFKVKLQNRFEVWEDMGVHDVNSHWNEIKDVMIDVGEQVLGKQRQKKKEWLSDESWGPIEERKAIARSL